MRRSTSGNDHFAAFPSDQRLGIRSKPAKTITHDPPPMTEASVITWLEQAHLNNWWRTQMPVSYGSLSKAMGKWKMAVHDFISGREKLPSIYIGLARIIPKIECRALIFPFEPSIIRGKGSKVAYYPPFLWTEPPRRPRAIGKISPEEAWDLWATCATCGKNKFIPLALSAKPHVACYSCFPPSQYASVGGVRTQKSLIHAFARQFY
jgi:hypothetical protein